MVRLALPTVRVRKWGALFLAVMALTTACGDDVVGPEGPAVTGTVTASSTGDPVAGAQVSIGSMSATTGTDGRFQLTGLTAGPAMLRATATGFEDFEADVTVASSPITRDISLTRIERFEFGDFALYIPATAGRARGVLLALGGPDTRAFATGAPFGAPVPEVEASLQTLGEELRTLAAEHGLAVLGTSLSALPNATDNDALLLGAVLEGATRSGRPELGRAPLLVYGMGPGGPQAAGFVARNPGRVAGLFLKVPMGLETSLGPDAAGVPTYVILAELDAFADNAALRAGFVANRSAGAPWALALEPGVPHHSLTPAHRELTVHWMDEILALRLGTTAEDPPRPVDESAGWLGVHVTRQAVPWSDDAALRMTSWLPSQATAEEWEAFGAAGPAWGILSLTIEPEALSVSPGSVGSLAATVLNERGEALVEPAVAFRSSDEGVVTVGHDQLCLPGCRDWVYVVPVAPGETTVVAEYAGVSDTARVTVVP